MSTTYAVIDVEATGGAHRSERIIEIGVVLYRDGKIIERFESLINPGIGIPPFISRLTGITQDMVAEAPPFYELAKQIVELTEDTVFVAHNVQFDYRMLRQEFERLGYTYQRPVLCTAKLSRHFFPEIEKHNLDKLIEHFDIKVKNRHRALADAEAACFVLDKILQSDMVQDPKELTVLFTKKTKLPDRVKEEEILELPNACGVYYMKDEDGHPVYIGKSKQIRSRIKSHFSTNNTKVDRMRSSVCHIDYELTGSELMAELLESKEIKKHKPSINRAKRRSKFPHAVYIKWDEDYPSLGINIASKLKKDQKESVLFYFSSKNDARKYIRRFYERNELCYCIQLDKHAPNQCLSKLSGKCKGAFHDQQLAASYRADFEAAIGNSVPLFGDDFVLLDVGQHEDNQSVFLISDGHLAAFGFMDKSSTIKSKDELIDQLHTVQKNKEYDQIVFRYLQKKHRMKKVRI